MGDYDILLQKHQRELHRMKDNDRNARKKGLQVFYETFDWKLALESNNIHYHNFLNDQFITNELLISIITEDIVERCREISLKLLLHICQCLHLTIESCIHSKNEIKINIISSIINKLCNRLCFIKDCPSSYVSVSAITSIFVEPTEELRFQIAEILLFFLSRHDTTKTIELEIPKNIADSITNGISKALVDSFPQMKRICAEILCICCQFTTISIRIHFKALLNGLSGNCLHQHSKTRAISLKALGLCLTCVTDEYESSMKEVIIPLLLKILNDRIIAPKLELIEFCMNVLQSRITSRQQLSPEDIHLVALLILLQGDDAQAVSESALQGLSIISLTWYQCDIVVNKSVDMDIVDGELELKSIPTSLRNNITSNTLIKETTTSLDLTKINEFLSLYTQELANIILEGVDSWTVSKKLVFIRGLNSFINLLQSQVFTLISNLLVYLGPLMRDEEVAIRLQAEECCCNLGKFLDTNDLLDLLLPRINGDIAGTNTISHRTNAIRQLTHTIQGFPSRNTIHSDVIVNSITSVLTSIELYEFRDVSIREALILFFRSIMDTFPSSCQSNNEISKKLALGLVLLQGKLPNEDDVLVSEASKKQLNRLACLQQPDCDISNINQLEADQLSQITSSFVSNHFEYILMTIHPLNRTPAVTFTSSDVTKVAFEILVNLCPRKAWKFHEEVIKIIISHLQLKNEPVAGSYEANMASYASIRGEENIPSINDIDVRLSMLALLEGMLRNGSKDWECSTEITSAAENIFRHGLLVNLIWRVGRVEATIRKVALTATYALIKAGAIKMTVLQSIAAELIPLLLSHLDDSDVTPRHLSVLCLGIIFERLRGSFNEEAIYDIYPKLLKRLDDSHDEIRAAICITLQQFLKCANKSCYSSTTIDYIADQLFIHLDDMDMIIQDAVLHVILVLIELDKESIRKKATNQLSSHQSPFLINKILQSCT